jgi:hypothetical protein
MREGNDSDLLFIEGQFIGVNLGADFCAEHEWGIKGLHTKLGIDVNKIGLDKRKVSKRSSDLHWVDEHQLNPKNKKDKIRWSGIYFQRIYDGYGPDINAVSYGRDLISLWDENGFCIISSDANKIAHLKELYDAFGSNDVAIWLGGGTIFKNSGLCIAIASRLPQEITLGWHDADVEHNKLMDDFRATGIEKKLADAKRKYYSLLPRRSSDGSLVFWLNTMDQATYKSGWYNLADLEAWIRNEGPILKAVKEG